MYSLAVDFGGTYIKVAVLKNDQIIEFSETLSFSGQGLKPRLRAVENLIETLLDKNSLSFGDIAGIGLAIPGLVNSTKKRVIATNAKYNDTINFSFAEWVKEFLDVPFIIENDAKAALEGEIAYGSAKGETDSVMMIFGTGIGTAAYINGALLQGKHFQAGCLGGHITTSHDGYLCTCGNTGCLEAQASNWALPIVANERKYFNESLLSECERIDYKSVIECSAQEDQFSIELLEDLIDHWAAGITNLVHAYDPDSVILSGGLMKSRDVILDKIVSKVNERVWTPWGELTFFVAEEPSQSVLLGLGSLVYKEAALS